MCPQRCWNTSLFYLSKFAKWPPKLPAWKNMNIPKILVLSTHRECWIVDLEIPGSSPTRQPRFLFLGASPPQWTLGSTLGEASAEFSVYFRQDYRRRLIRSRHTSWKWNSMEFFKFDLITRLIADIHFKKSNNTNLRWYGTETKKLVTHSFFFVMTDHGCFTINEIWFESGAMWLHGVCFCLLFR